MSPHLYQIPNLATGVVQVWKRNYLQFRKSLLMNFLWIALEPLLLLLALGYGLGSFVSNIQGVAFVDFFFPALLCISSMMISFFEASYGNYAKLTYQKTYSTMILTPLSPAQIVMGEIFWAATKGTLSALCISLLAGTFGRFDNVMLIPSLLVVFLASLLFASLGMLVASAVNNYDGILYPTSGFIVPMSLFCGTYFPLQDLPYGLKYLAYLFPLTHSVALVRALLLNGMPWWQYLIHILVLLVVMILLARWAIERISAKLVL